MPVLDPAVQAAAEALHQSYCKLGPTCGNTPQFDVDAASAAVAAAAPHIRAAERERIGRMLDRMAEFEVVDSPAYLAFRSAARLARSIPPEDIPGALTERQT